MFRRCPDGKLGSGPGAFFLGRNSKIPPTSVLLFHPRPSLCHTTHLRFIHLNWPFSTDCIAFWPYHYSAKFMQHVERCSVAIDSEHLLKLERRITWR